MRKIKNINSKNNKKDDNKDDKKDYNKFYTRKKWGKKDVLVKVKYEDIKHLEIKKI